MGGLIPLLRGAALRQLIKRYAVILNHRHQLLADRLLAAIQCHHVVEVAALVIPAEDRKYREPPDLLCGGLGLAPSDIDLLAPIVIPGDDDALLWHGFMQRFGNRFEISGIKGSYHRDTGRAGRAGRASRASRTGRTGRTGRAGACGGGGLPRADDY